MDANLLRNIDLGLCGLVAGLSFLASARYLIHARRTSYSRARRVLRLAAGTEIVFGALALNAAAARAFGILEDKPLDYRDVSTLFLMASVLVVQYFILKFEKDWRP